MLRALVTGNSVSPTAFGLSVHNAIAAQFSISRGDRAASVSIAAGAASAAAGVFEAAALLTDGADEVIVVCYDAPLPGDYAEFCDEPASLWAWAWRIARPSAGKPYITLRTAAGDGVGDQSILPLGLEVLRFALLTAVPSFRRHVDGIAWIWERHNA
jgi:hypothetical protein